MNKPPSIAELRRLCQAPVRSNNDLAGYLFGTRISIYVTSFCLRFGLSANFASWVMLLLGFFGSLLLILPEWWRVLGLLLVSSAFIFDCVDGEIARYHKIDSYRWAAFDYIHHMLVKALALFCLGIGLYLEYGTPWTMAAGGLALISWLLLMTIRDLATALFTKKIVLNEDREDNPAYQRLARLLDIDGEDRSQPLRDQAGEFWGDGFHVRPWLIRTFLMSFDIVMPLFLAVALIELPVGIFRIADVVLSPTILLIYFYSLILPIQALDLLFNAMRRGGLRNELYDLAGRIESYRKRP